VRDGEVANFAGSGKRTEQAERRSRASVCMAVTIVNPWISRSSSAPRSEGGELIDQR
jgi:hypothetical protein